MSTRMTWPYDPDRKKMKYLPKIGKLLLISVFTVTAFLVAASVLLQDKITAVIISSLNSNISTKIEAGHVKFSLFRNFPRASVELRNVIVRPSGMFNTENNETIPGDTLLYAKSLFLEFRPLDILKGNYTIEKIDLRSGTVNLFSDSYGRVNYNVTTADKTNENPVSIDLDKIVLSEISTNYVDLKNDLSMNFKIRDGRMKSRISGREIEFLTLADVEVNNISVSGTVFNNQFQARIDLKLEKKDDVIIFGKSTAEVEDQKLNIEGSVSENNIPDLSISGSDLDLSKLNKILPDSLYKISTRYNTRGYLTFDCMISGNDTGNNHLDVKFSISEGKISLNGISSVEDITVAGHYTNGFKNTSATSELDLDDISLKIGSGNYKGALVIKNFVNPVADIQISGRMFAQEIMDIFKAGSARSASGSVDIDLRLNGAVTRGKSLTTASLADMNPAGSAIFNSFSLAMEKPAFEIRDVSGEILFSDIIEAKELSLVYKDQLIKTSGKFRNLLHWLAGKDEMLVVDADVAVEKFLPGTFFSKRNSGQKDQVIQFPENVTLDLDFTAKNVSYETFSSTDVKGTLTYKPGLLTFKSLDMKSLDGTISGNGFIVQNANKTFMSRGDFSFSEIDINKAFGSFHNFGQDFIIASNLSGSLSGNVSLLLPMDSRFKISPEKIIADGTYNLRNGALINFEPVKQLSDFIELSELGNIHFQNLENDFYIRNNVLFIPQMDVKSSAADLTVNGQHNFENKYEYHVRVLLSQILSKKRKSNRKPVTEFGAVQDDGLGRTSLLLKVESRGDDIKVSYDLKAAGNEIKKDIRNEKQALKTILNEEYGWYGDQKQVAESDDNKKRKFSITWEETDSIPR